MIGQVKIDLTRPNSTYMAITFDSKVQLHQKLHFHKALIMTFQKIYNLFGFARSKFPHCFSNDVIVTLEDRFLQSSFCILVNLNCQSFIGIA